MNRREQGSHARGVYPTQHTQRMGTTIVNQEEEIGTQNSWYSSQVRRHRQTSSSLPYLERKHMIFFFNKDNLIIRDILDKWQKC